MSENTYWIIIWAMIIAMLITFVSLSGALMPGCENAESQRRQHEMQACHAMCGGNVALYVPADHLICACR